MFSIESCQPFVMRCHMSKRLKKMLKQKFFGHESRFTRRLAEYLDVNKSTFILNFIPVGYLCYFLSTMIKEAASLCSVDSAEHAEQSFADLILAYGDHKKFKLFHSLAPAGGSQVTSARWHLKQLLIW